MINILKLLLTVLVILKCAVALELTKCSIIDSECQKNFFHTVRTKYAPTGIPELGIPPLDPFDLSNVNITIMQLIHLSLTKGESLGIANCSVLTFESDVETFERTVEILCDRIVIQGNYTIRSDPIVKKIFGCSFHGDGYGSIVLNDWYFKLRNPIEFVERKDGHIYLVSLHEQGTYESKVLKNMVVSANDIKFNGNDIADNVIDYINKHWDIIFYTFGKSFNKQSMDYYNAVYDKFYGAVPATEFLSDDLTPYVKNNCSQCV